jgi:hypothetical protein
MAGKLSSQKGLIVEVDVEGYLAATKDLADCDLYVVTSNAKQVFNSRPVFMTTTTTTSCCYIPVLFL